MIRDSNVVNNVVICCIDKPGKGRDFYHSCYALSGLSIAQHNDGNSGGLYGDSGNLVRRTSAVFNIGTEKVTAALSLFSSLPNTHEALLK